MSGRWRVAHSGGSLGLWWADCPTCPITPVGGAGCQPFRTWREAFAYADAMARAAA